jgi:hypothetical protein
MEPVEKCTSALVPLIAAGHTNGIPSAEKAIDDMLLAIPPDQRRTSLDSVRSAVDAHRKEAAAPQCSFADMVNDYIEKLIISCA